MPVQHGIGTFFHHWHLDLSWKFFNCKIKTALKCGQICVKNASRILESPQDICIFRVSFWWLSSTPRLLTTLAAGTDWWEFRISPINMMYGALQKLVVMCHLCHWPDLNVYAASYDDYSSGNCTWLTDGGSLLWLISTGLLRHQLRDQQSRDQQAGGH